MSWNKLGLIVTPDPEIEWMSTVVGPSFVDTRDDQVLKIYVTGRDNSNVSRVGIVEVSKADPTKILKIHDTPVFDIGEVGTFDENGVSYPWLVQDGDQTHMYYVGWVNGGRARFQNATGLAICNTGSDKFRRVSRAPILGRTDAESIGTGSVCVVKEGEQWRIWYTSFVKWVDINNKMQHFYHIKYATSNDGISWVRDGTVAIDFKDGVEHTICKPMVIKDGNIYKMWYSCRGGSDLYRIGYAESEDGVNWKRMDDKVGIDVSPSGWDSEMIEYAYVFDCNDKRYMIYNGNLFGKTGLGLAVWS